MSFSRAPVGRGTLQNIPVSAVLCSAPLPLGRTKEEGCVH